MTQENMESLRALIKAGKISQGMAAMIAGSGLAMCHLQSVYQHGGKENMFDVLTEVFDGKPRVTNKKKIQADICSFFEVNTNEEAVCNCIP